MSSKLDGSINDLVLSEEEIERIANALRELLRQPKLPCVCDDCGGRIVSRASSLFHGVYHFSLPLCEQCGRSWHFAEHSIKTGQKEFQEAMQMTITI